MTIRSEITDLIRDILACRFPIASQVDFEVTRAPQTTLGDFATNVALVAAKAVGSSPMEVAQEIASEIQAKKDLIKSAAVASPGFINIMVTHQTYLSKLAEIIDCKDDRSFGETDIGKGKRIQVEFVSANPTGPLNVVSARAAAVGDALVKLLRRIGYQAQSEFYVNDCGTQVALLGESLRARFLEAIGREVKIPERGYPGEYLIDIAALIVNIAGLAEHIDVAGCSGDLARNPDLLRCLFEVNNKAREKGEDHSESLIYLRDFLEKIDSQMLKNIGSLFACYLSSMGWDSSRIEKALLSLEKRLGYAIGEAADKFTPPFSSESIFIGEAYQGWQFDFAKFAVEEIVRDQRRSLERFGKEVGGVKFDNWFRESMLKEDVLRLTDDLMKDSRFVIEKDGALWLKGGENSESDEWVIRRSNGEPTYFLTDIVYHINKRKRGFEKVIDIWGPDHHGHIKRMQEAMKVVSQKYPDLQIPPDWLRVLIVQQVNLVSKGKRVQMSKRAGEYITLDELSDEVGPDVTKFFFLMRRCNSHLDFDLDLAKLTSEENPVYYVQYAHARICSIFRYASARGYHIDSFVDDELERLESPEEIELLKVISGFDDLIIASALSLEPHRLTSYLIDLASAFHRFYHNHRVVTDDVLLTKARLCLCLGVRTVIRSGLWLMGISAPEVM